MKPLITVFTPAYNRRHTITRTYFSLCAQTNKNFVWLIIDDGSTDGTEDLIKEWKNSECGFEIHYIYKKNGGMHTAHNMAYNEIDTELNICIDSDDMLADNAIEIIESTWKSIKHLEYAGIIGLDADFNGNIIGTAFKNEKFGITLSGYYEDGGVGDKKLVYRTDIMKKYPSYPEFNGEKLVPLSYKYLMCDQEYQLYPINEILCNVEYQIDGSSNNLWPQYLQSPKGFAEFRKLRMTYSKSFKRIFIDCIHYVSSSILAKNIHFISESPKKLLTIIAIPCGILLTIYIKKRAAESILSNNKKMEE